MIEDAKVSCELANKGTSELYQNDINSLKQREKKEKTQIMSTKACIYVK